VYLPAFRPLRVTVFTPFANVGVAPSTLPAVPTCTVTLCGIAVEFVNVIATLPAGAVNVFSLNINIPLVATANASFVVDDVDAELDELPDELALAVLVELLDELALPEPVPGSL
jgi:hypothetical protein